MLSRQFCIFVNYLLFTLLKYPYNAYCVSPPGPHQPVHTLADVSL